MKKPIDRHNIDILAQAKASTEAVKALADSQNSNLPPVVPESQKVTLWHKNGESNKYAWTPEFATEVLHVWYEWYLTSSTEIMYTKFARQEMKITFKTLVKKIQEFTQDWEDIRDEMDLVITERLFEAGSKGTLDKDIVKLATKHLGLKWDDKTTLKVEGSIESELEKAFLARKEREKKSGSVSNV